MPRFFRMASISASSGSTSWAGAWPAFGALVDVGFAAVAVGIWLAVLIFKAIASGALHLF